MRTRPSVLMPLLTAILASAASAGARRPPKPTVILNEICYAPLAGQPEWVELRNAADHAVDIAGWVVTDEDGNDYKIPRHLPPVPPGGIVLVVFDGKGPGERPDAAAAKAEGAAWADALKEGKAVTLHTPLALSGDVFLEESDQCGLYGAAEKTPDTIVDYVVWGSYPNIDSVNAAEAGLWDREDVLITHRHKMHFGAVRFLPPGGSIVRNSTPHYRAGPQRWSVYGPSAATPGLANGLPDVALRYPEPNANVLSLRVSLSWVPMRGVERYQVQLAESPTFETMAVDEQCGDSAIDVTKRVEKHKRYHWRVRTVRDDSVSPWSETRSFTCQ